MILGPGDHPVPFEAQVMALRKVVANVCQQLKAKNYTKLSKKSIELERVVFTKVRDHECTAVFPITHKQFARQGRARHLSPISMILLGNSLISRTNGS